MYITIFSNILKDCIKIKYTYTCGNTDLMGYFMWAKLRSKAKFVKYELILIQCLLMICIHLENILFPISIW